MRGSAGVEVNPRRVLQTLAAVGVLALLAVALATTFGAARQNSAQSTLQHRGVPVQVTVTACEGVSSGVGQGLIYTVCHGSFVLGGHRYDEVIGGSREPHPVGQVLAGVTVPGQPALLSTAAAVAKRFSPWTPYVTPMALAVAGLAVAAGVTTWSRRSRRAQTISA